MDSKNPTDKADPLSTNAKEQEDVSEDEPLFEEKHEKKDAKIETKTPYDEDLFVTVSNPEKHVQTMETYISYKVTTQTTRSTFDESQFVVHRRYQDFVWLSEKLEEEYPTFIIPPLPSKFVVKGMLDRFSPAFTETRCRALNKFMERISKHPVISFSEHLKRFLISPYFVHDSKHGLLSRMGMGGSLKWSKVNNAEFEPINEAMTLFGEKMSVMDRIGERLLAEKKELVTELKEFSPTLTAWGRVEDGATESIMTSISNCLESCTEEAARNAKSHELEFIPPLKEYILYGDIVKQVLKRRDIIQSQFEKCDEELRLKKNEKGNLPKSDQSYSIGAMMGKSPEMVKEQKNEKLTQQIEEISTRREKLSDNLEQANSNFRADMERWKKHKAEDMATLLSKFAEAQNLYHKNCLAAWENVLPALKSPTVNTEEENDEN